MTVPIRNVSDTALWVAMYRAQESDRPDALFRDPYARRLAGGRGEAIVRALRGGRTMAWPMIVRTAVMDEIVLRLASAGVRTVCNLAAGLDARAYRLPLPPDLHWYDVDLPDMTAFRREHLADAAPVCVHEDVACDVADADARASLLARIAGDGAPALVVSEGLLIYLADEEVADLARHLYNVPALRWWLFDLATPALLARLRHGWAPQLDASNTPLRFAPAEGTAFFTRTGWREAEFRSVWDESLRLRRSLPLAPLWNALMHLQSRKRREAMRRMSGIVLLGREGGSDR